MRNWIARATHSFFYGKRQPGWAVSDNTFLPDAPVVNLLTDCRRPTGDPLKKRHWYGRAGSPATPFTSCLRCGTPNPYKRPSPEHEVKP